jgi:hypothetical protein
VAANTDSGITQGGEIDGIAYKCKVGAETSITNDLSALESWKELGAHVQQLSVPIQAANCDFRSSRQRFRVIIDFAERCSSTLTEIEAARRDLV